MDLFVLSRLNFNFSFSEDVLYVWESFREDLRNRGPVCSRSIIDEESWPGCGAQTTEPTCFRLFILFSMASLQYTLQFLFNVILLENIFTLRMNSYFMNQSETCINSENNYSQRRPHTLYWIFFPLISNIKKKKYL